jgi:hypothetical protein
MKKPPCPHGLKARQHAAVFNLVITGANNASLLLIRSEPDREKALSQESGAA